MRNQRLPGPTSFGAVPPSRRTGLVKDPIDKSLQRAQVADSAREADELVAADCLPGYFLSMTL